MQHVETRCRVVQPVAAASSRLERLQWAILRKLTRLAALAAEHPRGICGAALLAAPPVDRLNPAFELVNVGLQLRRLRNGGRCCRGLIVAA